MPRLHDSQTARLLNQFETVLAYADARTESQLRHRPIPDKWSVFEQLAHMGRYTAYFQAERLTVMLASDIPPVFGRYQADEDPGFAEWLAFDKQQLLNQFKAERRQITNRLMSLTDAELSHRAAHPLVGEMDIPGWTEFFLLHESHHLYAILRLLFSQSVVINARNDQKYPD